jgi:hypothetical protein
MQSLDSQEPNMTYVVGSALIGSLSVGSGADMAVLAGRNRAGGIAHRFESTMGGVAALSLIGSQS